MALRDTLRKVADLLVEMPEQADTPPPAGADEFDRKLAAIEQQNARLGIRPTPPTRTVGQIVAASPGPNLDQITVPKAGRATVLSADGTLDFTAIYGQANLPASAVTADQVLEMLGSLPKELPLETKRQTIKVMLNSLGKSLGATPETIVADASRKLAALTSYTDSLTAETGEMVSESQIEIASLEAKIAEKKRQVEEAQRRQQTAVAQCHSEGERLDGILEFFSLDVAPSALAPPSAGKAASK
jgi:hypothetical protein